MPHIAELILASLVGPGALALFGFFGRRAVNRIDQAAAERWDRVHERLDEFADQFGEERRDLRQTVADLARAQGAHERWARDVLTRMTNRVSRIEGRLQVLGDDDEQ